MLSGLIPPSGNDSLLEYLGTADSEITFAALVAFVAVDEFGHYGKAARFLGKQQQGLRQHVRKLEELLNMQLLDIGPGGEYHAVGKVSHELRDRARLMVFQHGAIGRLADKEIKIRFLPQHGSFMTSVEARLDGLVDIRSMTLGDEDRSMVRFHDNVIAPLAAGTIDLAVGPPPSPESPAAELLAPQYLYTSRHEAMVGRDDPRERITLAELVADGRLLVAPNDTHGRDLLEDAIAKDVPDDPGPDARVKREALDTKVLIQYGMKGLGTVVVPSAMAHPFYTGNDCAGPSADLFKWLPVCTSSGNLIYQDVFALIRRAPDRHSGQLSRIVNLIRQEVAQLELEKGPPETS
jgi:DNA-binding transcriptional LysR family regulator